MDPNLELSNYRVCVYIRQPWSITERNRSPFASLPYMEFLLSFCNINKYVFAHLAYCEAFSPEWRKTSILPAPYDSNLWAYRRPHLLWASLPNISVKSSALFLITSIPNPEPILPFTVSPPSFISSASTWVKATVSEERRHCALLGSLHDQLKLKKKISGELVGTATFLEMETFWFGWLPYTQGRSTALTWHACSVLPVIYSVHCHRSGSLEQVGDIWYGGQTGRKKPQTRRVAQ